MFTFLLIITSVVFILLIVVAGMQPRWSTISQFELRRRSKLNDKTAVVALRRDALLGDITSLLRIEVALLLVVMVLLLVATFGWVIGAILALVVAIEYGALSKVKFISNLSNVLYAKLEPNMLNFVEKIPGVFVFFRSVSPGVDMQVGIESRQHLQHLISHSETVLTADERRMIANGLSFQDQTVGSIMTPRADIDMIKHSEFLGPLTLDDLHKKGHSQWPVIKGDIDHVIGILHIQSLLALDVKRSVSAEKAMENRVLYIRYDQSLQHALAAFLKTHQHLFVVVDEDKKTVGVLTLNDVIESLIGRKIVDDFDSHESLRSVAAHVPKS